MTAAVNFTRYNGMLEFPDGTSGYTYLTMSKTQGGCVGNQMHNNWQYKHPPKELVYLMFSFGFSWVPFALSPVTLHRVMTSASADALKWSIVCLHAFPITFFIPVILIGATAGAMWPADPTSAFPLLAFKIAELSNIGEWAPSVASAYRVVDPYNV